MAEFDHIVKTEQELRDLVGEPSDLAVRKQRATLDQHCRAFIAQSPFLLLSTSGADGRCDVSPKGDAPGFVLVLDDTRLVIPDRPGNRRLDGMRNILENPHVGLIFLVPGREDTLRVNGRAWIVRDDALLDRCMAGGKRPLLAIGVEVEECFMHCAKALKRAHLWQTEPSPEAAALAPLGHVLWDQIRPEGHSPDDLERQIQDGYIKRLY